MVKFWDYKWLLNKKRRLTEKKFYNLNKKSFKHIKGLSNEKSNLIKDELIKNIKEVYDENIEYINSLNAINNNIIAFVISILALFISIIAIFK